jgi:hypothetical protein
VNRGTLLLAIVAAALGCTSLYLWEQLSNERELRVRAEVHVVDSSARSSGASQSGSLPQVVQSQEKARTEVSRASRSLEPWSSTSTIPVIDKAERPPATLAEQRDMALAQKKLEIRRWHPDLAAALQLRSDQADKLIDMLAGHELSAEENPPFVNEGELDWDDNSKPEWVRKVEAEQLRRDREIAQFLGDAKFRTWKEYAEGAEARRLVTQLRSMLDGTADPLRDDQRPLLTKAIVEAQRAHITDAKYQDTTAFSQFERYQQHLREAVTPYLSEMQLGQFGRLQEQQLEVARIYGRNSKTDTNVGGNPHEAASEKNDDRD